MLEVEVVGYRKSLDWKPHVFPVNMMIAVVHHWNKNDCDGLCCDDGVVVVVVDSAYDKA